MIDYACFCQIKHLHEQQGLSAAQIAATLGLDPRTVASWLTQERFRPRQPRHRASKLDPFKAQIVRMLDTYPYSAAQVFQRLREQGFAGGYSLVKAYVRTVRPTRQAAFLKLAFAPGECAQVDWGAFGSVPVGQTSRRLSFFVMVLCYSRMMYVEFTVSQTMEHFLACHQHAFEYFGAIPHKIMVDNLKSAVLKRALGEAPYSIPSTRTLPRTTAFASCRAMSARAMKRAGWKMAWATSKKLPGRSRHPGLPRPQSGRQAVARHRGQCPGSWRNPAEAHRPLATGKTLSAPAPGASLRYRHRVTG